MRPLELTMLELGMFGPTSPLYSMPGLTLPPRWTRTRLSSMDWPTVLLDWPSVSWDFVSLLGRSTACSSRQEFMPSNSITELVCTTFDYLGESAKKQQEAREDGLK
jgi:hypothetical protein